MFTAALTVAVFTLLARGTYGVHTVPFTLNPTLETDCNGPPAENQVAVIPDVSYPFRTDYLTLHEGKAYEEIPCSPTHSDRCAVHYYGNTHRNMYTVSPFYKTYFELDCTGYSFEHNRGGWKPFVQAYTKKFSILSPKRALTMKIREQIGIIDPVHSDVFEPVRGQVIDITIVAGVSTEVTSKIYHSGILPSLVALRIENGKNLSIKRQDFNQIPNVRLIIFLTSTIMEMEPYTFTDLPHLTSLSVDKGLRYIFRQIDDNLDGYERPLTVARWSSADLEKIHRIHCDCSFSWYRNFLNTKSELMEYKQKGAMAIIGSYVSEHFWVSGIDSLVASVDCAKDLTKDNYEAGDQFSYNTTCFGSCEYM